MRKRFTSLTLILLAFIGLTLPNIAMASNKIIGDDKYETSINIKRISGNDRYDTAVNISKYSLDKSNYAVVATGETFVDALIGGTLSVQIDAPILLVKANSIPKNIIEELKRLEVKKIFLLGGNNSISEKVENDLKNLDIKVERLAGSDRHDTAEKITFKKVDLAGSRYIGDYYIGVDSYNFPDALSAAPFIGHNPFNHLVPYAGGDVGVRSYRMVFGGEKSVPKSESEIYRFAGNNRYATAVEIAKGYKSLYHKNIDTVVLVNGMDFPDALASSTITSLNNGALLLTDPNNLSKETKDYIKEYNIKNIIIIGGENSVSSSIEKELKDIKIVFDPNEEKYSNLEVSIDDFNIKVNTENPDDEGNIYAYLTVTNNSKYTINDFSSYIIKHIDDDNSEMEIRSIRESINPGDSLNTDKFLLGTKGELFKYDYLYHSYEYNKNEKIYLTSYYVKSDLYTVDLLK